MVRLHPLQVKGKYFVEYDSCISAKACEAEAPENFAVDENGAYVYKQPTTPDEEEDCQRALGICPYGAIRDDGKCLEDLHW
jgi:ferredoxin